MTSRHPLPDAALDDRLFFGGTAGAGKTYNAMGAVERLLGRGDKVVIPDPLGVWWGLRLAEDGRCPSRFDVVIFGGPHGDLPLTEHSGAVIGETVAGMRESCILDLSQLGTKAAERRFMLAFLSALYRHVNGQPLHVVFDEADMWAPQRLLDKEGEAAKLLGMMETVVRRGRVKGFVPWLISQRPAVISKDILSQVDGIVAFKLTGKHDRDAIGSWVEGLADKTTWAAIERQLPAMERGQGVVWIPGRGLLETVRFPLKTTFDSSRTPKRGEKAASVELRPIDLGALRERLGKVEAEAKANDPSALKTEIRRLTAELAKKPAAVVDRAAIDREVAQALEDGFVSGFNAAQNDAVKAIQALPGRLSQRVDIPHTPRAASPPPAAPPVRHSLPPSPPRREGSEGLGKGDRLVLTVLAQYRPIRVSASKAAAIAGYSVRSSTWRNILSRLRRAALIEQGPEPYAITDDGLNALGSFDPLPTGAALLEHWMARVGKGDRETLRILATLHGECPSPDLAQRAGYSPSSSTWRNILSRLRTLGLIEGSRNIKLHEDLR